ncbi:PPOX class F420-dependent enzyme [Prauserella marina]|uniref:PPOX class probable F420-dependent enzyme n=1 Tax=Prauserella marina TaxID=530584 RepID=A0A222VPD5_9PSEU|nr:PPOX class F420-dependent oxidoreductase [Prauserella marina]ASR35581.1 PPOX class F420-dependent enzyme [Prauserella marina]PWV84565.1 PPOX class probable F420-dependent enzyme [Prauserella marina]SDC19049.1 PPOX class probable F420-dependent enzyme [Prauserella marina]
MGVNQREEIVMSADEITNFLTEQRIATLATVSPSGQPHLVAMWYALIDGVMWFETKAKSQKAVNIRRDDRVTVMVETGHTYDALRGVALEGRATIVDDPGALWAVGVNVWERYTGPYTEEVRPMVEFMLRKRLAVRIDVQRCRSWDHRKLELPEMPLGGSTAAFL